MSKVSAQELNESINQYREEIDKVNRYINDVCIYERHDNRIMLHIDEADYTEKAIDELIDILKKMKKGTMSLNLHQNDILWILKIWRSFLEMRLNDVCTFYYELADNANR